MIQELKGDDRITIISCEEQTDLIIVNYDGSVDLYQNEDWIALDKSQVKELIKVLKKYAKL